MIKPTSKKLGIFSIITMNIVAVISLRSIPITASYGVHIIFFYIIAILGFFIPTILVTAELSSAWPKKGGIYVWIKEAFSKPVAFLIIWIQWLYNMVWYPTILAFLSTTAAKVMGIDIINNRLYLLASCLTFFWASTLLHFKGIETSSRLSTFGATIGTIIPIMIIIFMALFWILDGNTINIDINSIENIIPPSIEYYAIFPIILFTMVGIEVSTVHAQDVKNPEKNYPIAILSSTIIICLCLILSPLALSVVVPSEEINILTGIIDVFNAFLGKYHIKELTTILAIFILINGFCSVSTWIIGPTKSLQAAAIDGYCPAILKKQNSNGAPTVILFIQGVVFSLLCSLFLLFPSIYNTYWLLSTLTSQLSIGVYIVLFLSAIKLRIHKPDQKRTFKLPRNNIIFISIASLGIFTCSCAILIGFIPPKHIQSNYIFWYEIILITGMLIAILPPTIWSKIRHIKMKETI